MGGGLAREDAPRSCSTAQSRGKLKADSTQCRRTGAAAVHTRPSDARHWVWASPHLGEESEDVAAAHLVLTLHSGS